MRVFPSTFINLLIFFKYQIFKNIAPVYKKLHPHFHLVSSYIPKLFTIFAKSKPNRAIEVTINLNTTNNEKVFIITIILYGRSLLF